MGAFLDVEGIFNQISKLDVRRGAEEHGISERFINWVHIMAGLLKQWAGL